MAKTLKNMLEVYAPKSKDEKRFKDKHVVAKYKLDDPSKDDKVFNGTNVKEIDREATRHGYNIGNDEKVYEETKPLHPKAIVVSHSGKGKYKVHAVGDHFADGIKVGERLSDTELDDAAEMGAKIINKNTEIKTKNFVKEESLDEKHLTPAEMKKREEIAMAIERQHPGYSKSKKMAIATAAAKRVAESSDILEGENARDQFNAYHNSTAKLLKKITNSLSDHYDTVTNKKGINNGNPHWGHVGDIKSIHRQLQDLHDQILQTGEYANPKKMVGESYDFDDEDVELLNAVYEGLSDENRVILEDILENNPDQLIEFLDQLELE